MSINGYFPRVGVPPFIVIGFSIVNHAFLDTPMKIPKYYNPRLSRKIPGFPARARGSCAQRPFQRFPWRSENAIGFGGACRNYSRLFVCIHVYVYVNVFVYYIYICSWYTQMGGAHHFLTVELMFDPWRWS